MTARQRTTGKAARLGLLVTGLAGAVAACQLIVGVEPEADTARPPPRDASVVDAGAPDVDPCPHARPPAPPTSPSDPRATTHMFAVRRVTLGGLSDPDLPHRFDFDNLCTCANHDDRAPNTSRVSCVQPGEPCSAAANSDDDHGADLGGEAFLVLGPVGLKGLEKTEISDKFEDGRRGMLIGIGEYNETDNDTSVTVSLVGTGGVARPAPAPGSDAGPVDRPRQQVCDETTGPTYKPRWDGTTRDVWYGPTQAASAAASRAYVTGGLLVLDGTAASVKLPMFGQVLEQSRSIFVGRIARSPAGALTLRGNLVGVVSTAKLLSIFGSFQLPDVPDGGAQSLCQGPLFPTLTNVICSGRDLLESGDDRTRPCDASAMAVGFEAEEITLGDPSPVCPPIVPYPCDAQCPAIDAGGGD